MYILDAFTYKFVRNCGDLFLCACQLWTPAAMPNCDTRASIFSRMCPSIVNFILCWRMDSVPIYSDRQNWLNWMWPLHFVHFVILCYILNALSIPNTWHAFRMLRQWHHIQICGMHLPSSQTHCAFIFGSSAPAVSALPIVAHGFTLWRRHVGPGRGSWPSHLLKTLISKNLICTKNEVPPGLTKMEELKFVKKYILYLVGDYMKWNQCLAAASVFPTFLRPCVHSWSVLCWTCCRYSHSPSCT